MDLRGGSTQLSRRNVRLCILKQEHFEYTFESEIMADTWNFFRNKCVIWKLKITERVVGIFTFMHRLCLFLLFSQNRDGYEGNYCNSLSYAPLPLNGGDTTRGG